MTAFASLVFAVVLLVSAQCMDIRKSHDVKEGVPACPSYMTQCGSGCCPAPSAVCCSDGVHCCPNGFTCNYQAGGCTRGTMMSPFFDKTPYLSHDAKDDVKEGVPACPSYMTQCGSGCCPAPSAVCCSDGVHCCPNGFTCNYQAGGCTRGTMMSPFFEKAPYLSHDAKEDVKEGVPACPSYMTQCGSGCCPAPSAVCCSDGVHCCPNGFTCNYQAGGCTRGTLMSPFFDKTTHLSHDAKDDVKEGVPACPSYMTQCGSGCCPAPSAVCCSDGVHCCPNGFTCNYQAGGCTRGTMMSPFFEKAMF